MFGVKLISVGKMRERYYIDAHAEYIKRLSGDCNIEITELPETVLTVDPSDAEVKAALLAESREIIRRIPKGAYVIALCVEGKMLSSNELASLLKGRGDSGQSRLCFIVGGSYGLDESVKKSADFRLSLSKMTFPHHLARVMLAEQIYRAFMINKNSKYHK